MRSVWAASAGVGLALLALPAAVAAQTPYVPDEWRFGRQASETTLSLCIDKRDPDWELARDIANAIAGALLLKANLVLIEEESPGDELDLLYRMLIERCQAHLGFKLIADAYPDWLTVTRAYYRSSYLVIAADRNLKALAELPPTQAIAATLGTVADLRLIQYLQALPAAQRWSRFPMSNDLAALRAVISGSAGAALVWAPSFWALGRSDPAIGHLAPIAPRPLPVTSVEIGAALLAKETFLRTNLDRAIASLIEDGSMARLLQQAAFPGTPPA